MKVGMKERDIKIMNKRLCFTHNASRAYKKHLVDNDLYLDLCLE